MSDTIIIDSHSIDRTMAVGEIIATACNPGDVVALIGELGAGKTQFVRGMARGLGIDPARVSSPTFVIAHEYESPDGKRVLVHVDAYRLGGRNDLVNLGFAADEGSDLGHGAVMAVEWADRVMAALPADRLVVRMEHIEDGRRLTITGLGTWGERMIPLRQALEALP